MTDDGEDSMQTPAETMTLTIVIRPTYADADTVKAEIEDSLAWLVDEHDAIVLRWHSGTGAGIWEEDDEDDD